MGNARPLTISATLLAIALATAQTPTKPQAPIKPMPQAPAAELLLASARAKAKADGKNVLVIFNASWCKWCKRLDAFMAQPELKPVFEANFVTVHLTVLERADKQKLENPGAMDVMTWLGGKDAGLPFFAILNPEGQPVITSLRPIEGQEKGSNTGHPVAPEEVGHFVEMMKRGAPKAKPDQIEAIRSFLSSQKI